MSLAGGGLIFHHMECACLKLKKQYIGNQRKGEEGGRGGEERVGIGEKEMSLRKYSGWDLSMLHMILV